MAHFTWDDSFSVGIEQLDKQHKNIVRGINALSDSMEEGTKTKKTLFKLFRALKAYTDVHFSFEEDLLKKSHYPELDAHLHEHQQFIQNLETLQNAFESDFEKVNIEIKMMDFLKDWLINHIMMMDKKYTKHLQKKGVNK